MSKDFLRDRELELPIEVEVASLLEVQEVLGLLNGAPKCMVTRIMLDNMAIVDPAAQGRKSCPDSHAYSTSVPHRFCC